MTSKLWIFISVHLTRILLQRSMEKEALEVQSTIYLQVSSHSNFYFSLQFFLTECEIDGVSEVNLQETENIFTNNSASNLGGAIYWNYYRPANVLDQMYDSNSAGVYGNDFASYAQTLRTITSEEYEQISNGSTRR